MAKVNVTTRDGTRITLDGHNGVSVMETIRSANIDVLLALCGGNMSCATCHVYVDAVDFGKLNPMSPDEADLLDATGIRRETSRLSCQILLSLTLDELSVTIAPEP